MLDRKFKVKVKDITPKFEIGMNDPVGTYVITGDAKKIKGPSLFKSGSILDVKGVEHVLRRHLDRHTVFGSLLAEVMRELTHEDPANFRYTENNVALVLTALLDRPDLSEKLSETADSAVTAMLPVGDWPKLLKEIRDSNDPAGEGKRVR